MSKSIVNPDMIHLTGIRVIKEHLESTDQFLNDPKDISSFVFGHSYLQSMNIDNNSLRVRLYLKLKGVDENEKDMGVKAEYGVEFHFVVDNLDQFVEKPDDDIIKLKGTLSPTLAGIAYSTARGIIWEKLSGTFFSHIILPIINPAELLKSSQ